MSASRARQVGQALTALSAVVVVYATLAPSPDAAGGVNDRLIHFFLFIPLGFGGALWMAQLEPAQQRRARVGILVVGLLFAAATELAQAPMEARTADLGDFIADAAGLGLGLVLGGWLAARAERTGT